MCFHHFATSNEDLQRADDLTSARMYTCFAIVLISTSRGAFVIWMVEKPLDASEQVGQLIVRLEEDVFHAEVFGALDVPAVIRGDEDDGYRLPAKVGADDFQELDAVHL